MENCVNVQKTPFCICLEYPDRYRKNGMSGSGTEDVMSILTAFGIEALTPETVTEDAAHIHVRAEEGPGTEDGEYCIPGILREKRAMVSLEIAPGRKNDIPEENFKIFDDLADYSDILIAEGGFAERFCIRFGAAEPGMSKEKLAEVFTGLMLKRHPGMLMASVLRSETLPEGRTISACLNDRTGVLVSGSYDIGWNYDPSLRTDGFSAGLIYGLKSYASPKFALEFAAAAASLTDSGDDAGKRSIMDVMLIMKGFCRSC